MNEDRIRNRRDNRPYNPAIPRHMAINVMRKEGSKGSMRGKFKRAGLQDAYPIRLLSMSRCAITLRGQRRSECAAGETGALSPNGALDPTCVEKKADQ